MSTYSIWVYDLTDAPVKLDVLAHNFILTVPFAANLIEKYLLLLPLPDFVLLGSFQTWVSHGRYFSKSLLMILMSYEWK